MNILIIEDERPAAEQLKRITERLRPDATIFGPLDSVKSSVEWLMSNPVPDLVFCDIQLADGISFEIFEQVRVKPPIIFTTAYDQFAIRAFKLNSLDYLLKPIDPDELTAALDKLDDKSHSAITSEVIKKLLNSSEAAYKIRFIVKAGDNLRSIHINDIDWFSSEDKVTFIHTTEGKRYIIDYSLNDLEGLLNPEKFFRINRQYIISITSIHSVLIYSNSRLKVKLKLCKDDSILISRNKVDLFKQWMDGGEVGRHQAPKLKN